MGVTPNLTGYRYLKQAVILSVKNPAILNSVYKLIYQSIANQYNTTSRNVDRGIRCAIDSAYKKAQNIETVNWNRIMEECNKSKPTNVQMINFLANKARLEM